MTKSITNVRVYHKVAVGFAFQKDAATAATVSQFMKEADVSFAPGYTEFEPSGTDGQMFHARNGHRIAHQEPAVTVQTWCSRTNLAKVLESFTGGQPTASGTGLTVANAQITSPVLTGIRPYDHCENVASCQMTLEISSNGSNWDLKLYSEAAKTSLLASQTNLADGGTVAMTAQNDSGLTVAGTLASPPTAGDHLITVKQVVYAWANHPHNACLGTFAFDDGYQLHQLDGCHTRGMKITSGGREGVRLEWEMAAYDYTYSATTYNASVEDNDYLCSRDLTLLWDEGTLDYSLPTEGSFTIEGSWDLTPIPDNAAHPEYYKRENPQLSVTADIPETTESAAIQARARAAGYNPLKASFDYGDYGLEIDMGDTVADPNVLPEISGKEFSTNSLVFRARSDATDATPSVASIKIDWRA